MREIITVNVTVSVITTRDEAEFIRQNPDIVVFDDISNMKKVVKKAEVTDSEMCDDGIDAVRMLTDRYRTVGI